MEKSNNYSSEWEQTGREIKICFSWDEKRREGQIYWHQNFRIFADNTIPREEYHRALRALAALATVETANEE